jgi:hypothetical protein
MQTGKAKSAAIAALLGVLILFPKIQRRCCSDVTFRPAKKCFARYAGNPCHLQAFFAIREIYYLPGFVRPQPGVPHRQQKAGLPKQQTGP